MALSFPICHNFSESACFACPPFHVTHNRISGSIGVITKIDIMDQGTDAATMLRGEDVPLRLGYVGVKMRSQQDIVNKKPVKDSLKDEKDWFENHRVYSSSVILIYFVHLAPGLRSHAGNFSSHSQLIFSEASCHQLLILPGKLPPGLVGTPVLIDKLTQILFKHIRRFLPEIKKDSSLGGCVGARGRLDGTPYPIPPIIFNSRPGGHCFLTGTVCVATGNCNGMPTKVVTRNDMKQMYCISITRAGPFACLRLRTLRDGDGENSNRQSAAPEFDPRRSMRNVAQCKIAWMSLARASHWIRLRGCRSCGRWSRTTARCSKTQFAPG